MQQQAHARPCQSRWLRRLEPLAPGSVCTTLLLFYPLWLDVHQLWPPSTKSPANSLCFEWITFSYFFRTHPIKQYLAVKFFASAGTSAGRRIYQVYSKGWEAWGQEITLLKFMELIATIATSAWWNICGRGFLSHTKMVILASRLTFELLYSTMITRKGEKRVMHY